MWWTPSRKPRQRRRIRYALLLLALLGPGRSPPAAQALPSPAAPSPPAKPQAAPPALVFEGPLAPVQVALRGGHYSEAAQRAQRLLPTLKEPAQRDEAARLFASSPGCIGDRPTVTLTAGQRTVQALGLLCTAATSTP